MQGRVSLSIMSISFADVALYGVYSNTEIKYYNTSQLYQPCIRVPTALSKSLDIPILSSTSSSLRPSLSQTSFLHCIKHHKQTNKTNETELQ